MLLLAVHAAVTCALAGLIWLVQVLVYPGFLTVGPTAAWPEFHDAHSARIAAVIALPWLVQGVCTALLLVDRPTGVPLWLVLLTGALAAATVVVTVLVSVPLHTSLSTWDPVAAQRLIDTNWLRTVAWSGGAVCSVAMLVLHARRA